MANNESPCLSCIRVKDPDNCENKTCKLWSEWFISWWEGIRDKYKPQEVENVGGAENE